MSTPPRRRRSVTPPPPSGGGGWIATAAIALGVAVAGLGIGVLLAAYQQRAKSPDKAIAQVTQGPTIAPVPVASRAPIAIATIVARRTPRPTPSPAPSVSASVQPSATPSPAATARATSSATPAPKVAAAERPTPKPETVTPPPSLRSAPPAPPILTQSTVTRAPVPVTAAPTLAPAPVPPTSAMALAASGTVRRYLEALTRGDETTGYALLGGTDRGQQLSEESFLDPGARITAIRSKRVDDSNATVEAEIMSAKGTYSVNYHVTATPRGPIITQHDFIKV